MLLKKLIENSKHFNMIDSLSENTDYEEETKNTVWICLYIYI